MKNPTEPFGNRNRDLSACSAVPQQITPPRTPTGNFSRHKKPQELTDDMGLCRENFNVSVICVCCI
jgi:hypothetical protein